MSVPTGPQRNKVRAPRETVLAVRALLLEHGAIRRVAELLGVSYMTVEETAADGLLRADTVEKVRSAVARLEPRTA